MAWLHVLPALPVLPRVQADRVPRLCVPQVHPLRCARARDGCHLERHRRVRWLPALLRHVPELLRLRARRCPRQRAVALPCAVHVRAPCAPPGYGVQHHGEAHFVRVTCVRACVRTGSFTHDSIGLGEDGPTHQPIEMLVSLRGMPNMTTFRPADATEVVGASAIRIPCCGRAVACLCMLRRLTLLLCVLYIPGAYTCAIANADGPSVLALTRQNTRNLEGSDAAKVAKGAYTVFSSGEGAPAIIFAATGSEVELAIDAASTLDVATRVVSMPCLELYEKQSAEYKYVRVYRG